MVLPLRTPTQIAEPFLKRHDLAHLNFIKGDAHAHIRLGVNNAASGLNCLLMVDELNLYGRSPIGNGFTVSI
jgi:hypothetical protein